MLMRPTRGFFVRKTSRVKTLPMTANSSRWRALHWAFAPTSRSTVRPVQVGDHGGEGGPVHLLERAQDHLGDGPAGGGVARGEEGVGRAVAHALERNLDGGPLLEGGQADLLAPCPPRRARPRPRWARRRRRPRRQLRLTTASGPTRAARRPSSRQASTDPSTTTPGPWSPPMASTATRGAAFVSVMPRRASPATAARPPRPRSPACPCSGRSGGRRGAGASARGTAGRARARRGEVVVGPPAVAAGLGMAALRIRHR